MKIMKSEKHTGKKKENSTEKLIKCGPTLSTLTYTWWYYLRGEKRTEKYLLKTS